MIYFSQINTNDNIFGIIKEIMVDKTMEGESIGKYVIPIASCNSYRLKKHKKEFLTTGIKVKVDGGLDIAK
jgi:hypothetical protein